MPLFVLLSNEMKFNIISDLSKDLNYKEYLTNLFKLDQLNRIIKSHKFAATSLDQAFSLLLNFNFKNFFFHFSILLEKYKFFFFCSFIGFLQDFGIH